MKTNLNREKASLISLHDVISTGCADGGFRPTHTPRKGSCIAAPGPFSIIFLASWCPKGPDKAVAGHWVSRKMSLA